MTIFLLLTSASVSAVRQVRVIVDRAGIYIEPSRTSSQIEVVGKGTVLNLFQQKKVKDVWYYISFSSARYGSRISGFIHESSVEPIDDAAAAKSRVEEKKKPVEEGQPAPPKVEPKPGVRAEASPALKPVETFMLTALPKGRSFDFPRREPARKELAWIPAVTARPKEAPKPVVAEKKELPAKAAEMAPSKPTETTPPTKKEQPSPLQPEPRMETPVKKKAEKPPEKEAKPPVRTTPPPSQPAPVKPARQTLPGRKPGLFTVGLGYGSSFGGAGASLQLDTRSGFAFHAGLGLYPTTLIYSETDWVENRALFSVGLKYYLRFPSETFYPYVDLQYGGLRIEAAQVVIGIWEYSYVYSQEQKALYGLSLLTGTEIRLGRLGINGAVGLSYCLTDWEFLQNKVFLAFDASLIFYF